ncbi:MAG: hypothetical protein J6D15_04640 [Clostridia bacterium]|nr:hypothetical protein [Clostridia bacterium]
MKKIFAISFVFIGLVIGAGFASGREIFEYFCIPSQTDLTGIAIATISFGAASYIILDFSARKSIPDFKGFVDCISGRLSPLINFFMLAFMFCGFFVMMSACGALAKETLALPPLYGHLFLALCCFAVFCFDVKGLVAFNSVLVPIMLVGMLYVSLSSLLFDVAPTFSGFSKLYRNPLVSALCYVSYNTITAGAVLVPLAKNTRKSQLKAASVISASVLGMVIFIAWLSMNFFFDELLLSEMPLLHLAEKNSETLKLLYSLVLFMALCTTAVSHGFGIISNFHFKKHSHRIIFAALLCLSAIPFAGLAFSTLVSKLYSAFGYLGLLWTAMLILSYIKDK